MTFILISNMISNAVNGYGYNMYSIFTHLGLGLYYNLLHLHFHFHFIFFHFFSFRTARCWLARAVDNSADGDRDRDGDKDLDGDQNRDDDSPCSGSGQNDTKSFSLKLLVSVIDPYEQSEEDLDPTPIRDAPLTSISTSSSKGGYSNNDDDVDDGEVYIQSQTARTVVQTDGIKKIDSGSLTSTVHGETDDSNLVVPLTVREQEAIVKRFKATLREISHNYGAEKKLDLNLRNQSAREGFIREGEGVLTTLMISLQSMDALAQCLLLVDCFEILGDVDKTDSANRCDVIPSPPLSVEFHRRSYQLMRSMIAKSERVGEHLIASVDLELVTRMRLLGGYQSLLELHKNNVRSYNSTEAEAAQAIFVQESMACLYRQSSSKAEAACWLQRLTVNKAEENKQKITETISASVNFSGYILPFSVYRSLHGPIELKKGITSISDFEDNHTASSEISFSLNSGLLYLLSVLTPRKSLTIDGIDTESLKSFKNMISNSYVSTTQHLSISPLMAASVVHFLITPLLGGLDGADIFGLQSYCLSLESSSLSTPQALRTLLPCVVTNLERCTKEEVAACILLKDISSSPLQRSSLDKYFIQSCPLLSSPALSCPLLSCLILFSSILSSSSVAFNPIISYSILSCPLLLVLFNPIISYFILFCPTLSYSILFHTK